MRSTCPSAGERQARRIMDNEDDHAGRVNKRIRISLPNASGALSTVTAAVSARGGLVRAVQNLHEDLQRRVVEIDLVAADQKQFAAIIGAIKDLDGALVEGETDPALEAHRGGTITVQARVPFRNEQDFSTIYTPGAARVAQAIARAPELAHAYTAIPHLVALVTNGTAVLGLGDIGPRAAMPVLEGKAVLLDTFALLSGVPILLDTKDPKEMVRTLLHIAPTFAAICLEGIAAPACFAVEEYLVDLSQKPIWHDDQHGVAVVVLAALLTLARRSRRSLKKACIGLVGLGAAGVGVAKLLRTYGVQRVLGTDLQAEARAHLAHLGGQPTTLEGVMQEAEVVVATSGAPGCIQPELVRRGQTLLALSHPEPEISPEDALAAGAQYAADGRTLTSALAVPGLLRGALDARISRFTDAMKFAAAAAIARHVKEPALVPAVLDPVLHLRVARAVRDAARREQALAGNAPAAPTRQEVHDAAR